MPLAAQPVGMQRVHPPAAPLCPRNPCVLASQQQVLTGLLQRLAAVVDAADAPTEGIGGLVPLGALPAGGQSFPLQWLPPHPFTRPALGRGACGVLCDET